MKIIFIANSNRHFTQTIPKSIFLRKISINYPFFLKIYKQRRKIMRKALIMKNFPILSEYLNKIGNLKR